MKNVDLFHQSVTMEELLRFQDACVIALDVGGGYFSAQCLRGADGRPRELYVDDRLSLRMYSAVGYDYTGDAVSGFEITRTYAGREAEKAMACFTHFKAVPTERALNMRLTPDGDEESAFCVPRRRLMADAVEALFQGIIGTKENELGDCPRGEMLLLVGIPSSGAWRQEKDRYLELIREATGVGRVLSLSESSAAILYMMQEFPGRRSGSVLIVDLGAFSADVTYLPAGKRKPVEMSIELGGRMIDRHIAARLRKKGAALTALEVREGKERFWPEAKGEARFGAKESGWTLTAQEMDACVQEDKILLGGVEAAYTAHLQALIAQFAREQRIAAPHGSDAPVPVDTVMIVGGAANMTGAYRAVCDAAARYWPDAKICPEESRRGERRDRQCVSGGLLEYYSRAVPVITGMEHLEAQLRACLKERLFPALQDGMAEKLAPVLLDGQGGGVIAEQAARWAKEPEDRSRDQLMQAIREALEQSGAPAAAACALVTPEALQQLAAAMAQRMSDFVRAIYRREDDGEAGGVGGRLQAVLEALPQTLTPVVMGTMEAYSMGSLRKGVLGLSALAVIWVMEPLTSMLLGGLMMMGLRQEEGQRMLSAGQRRQIAQRLCSAAAARALAERMKKSDVLDRMLEEGGFDAVIREATARLKEEIEAAVYA